MQAVPAPQVLARSSQARPSGVRARAGSRPQHLGRGAPGHGLAGQQQHLSKCSRTCSRSCSTAITVRPPVRQRCSSASRSAVVRASMALKGSSSRISPASCSSTRANSTRCACPADSSPSQRSFEAAPGPRRPAPRRCGLRPAACSAPSCRCVTTGPWPPPRARAPGSCGPAPSLRQVGHAHAPGRARCGLRSADRAPARPAGCSCPRRWGRPRPSACRLQTAPLRWCTAGWPR
jgi:hypothetical protein